jgi:hypothetical protein
MARKQTPPDLLARLASRDAGVRIDAERELEAMGPEGAEMLVAAMYESRGRFGWAGMHRYIWPFSLGILASCLFSVFIDQWVGFCVCMLVT